MKKFLSCYVFVFVFFSVSFSKPVRLNLKPSLLVKSVDVFSMRKGLKFKVETNREVRFASVVIGFLPEETSFYPVYRFSVNKFTKDKKIEIFVKWKKFKWYLKKDKTIVFYKINLIDEDGYEEQYRSNVLIGKNHKILQTVVNGPFFDRGEENNYVVSFELLYPEKAVLNFNGKEYVSAKASKRHFFKIGRLKKGDYPYFVKGYPRVFKAKVNEANEFSFAFMSDSRNTKTDFDSNFENTNAETLEKAFLSAYSKGVDFVVFIGDLVSGYTGYPYELLRELKSWAYSTVPVSSIIPVYEGMGNHEACMDCFSDNGIKFCRDKKGRYSAESIFADVFLNPENGDFNEGECTPSYRRNAYYFGYGHCLFIVLNSNYWWSSQPERYGGNLEGNLMKNELKWLEDVLKTKGKGKREIFVFTHEPAFPCSAHLRDGMYHWGGLPEKNNGIDRRYVVKARNKFLKLLDKYGVKIVFFGDEHNYTRVLINKDIAPINGHITQIISGGAGAPFYELADSFPWKKNLKAFSKENHFILVKVGEKIEVEAVSIHGYVVDRFILE